VRVLEVRGQRDLALESCGADLARVLGRQQLDHDLTVERPLDRQKEPAHATRRELALDPVGIAERRLQPIAYLSHSVLSFEIIWDGARNILRS
jgi:hypothetical protein